MPSPARWLLPDPDVQGAAELSRQLRIHLPAARVLWTRGLREAEAARRFLDPSFADLHDPFLLTGMRAAVDRLVRAIRNKEHILLYGDYDVDGTTSIVILKKGIELAGGQADFHVPNRLRDGYGMRPEVVERAAAEGVSLVISVDTGIRAAEVVKRAADLSLDVIITDHHLPEAELPPALAVLNPNRRDCAYPDKNLCGVGVAFKLLQGLWQELAWPAEKVERLTLSLLKLVAIGTVADVVPLVGENRVFVKHGLAGLKKVKNHGLRALKQVAGFAEGDTPSSGQVAFRIAPRINAAGRMDDASDVVRLFLAETEADAGALAARLNELNAERQEAEAEMVRSILEGCERSPVTDAAAALVFAGRDWQLGVVGIVASRLVDRFHRPVFVLTNNLQEGMLQGSGRSIPGFHLLQGLEAMSDLFRKFGGHRQAAGVTLEESRLEEFRRRFNEYALSLLMPEDFRPRLEIDSTLDLSEIGLEAVMEILALAPFGCGNPVPVFCARGVEVAGTPSVMKEKHLRVIFRQNGTSLPVKAWNFAGRVEELAAGAKLDIAFSLDEDSYSAARGYQCWSAALKDCRKAE